MRHLTEYSQTLRLSGYSYKERCETIRGAIIRHKEMEKKVKKGEIPSLNRTKREIQERKTEKGGITAGSWYLRGETVRVVTVQPIPGGRLQRAVTEFNQQGKFQRQDNGCGIRRTASDSFPEGRRPLQEERM